MDEKYQGLQLIASALKILAWIMGAIGFISSIFLSIAASAVIPKLYLLMGGLLFSAMFSGYLLALSEPPT